MDLRAGCAALTLCFLAIAAGDANAARGHGFSHGHGGHGYHGGWWIFVADDLSSR